MDYKLTDYNLRPYNKHCKMYADLYNDSDLGLRNN